jgi:tetratricopeptide (TPR) repeat protein
MDKERILRPLQDGARAIEQLDDYETTEQLSDAIQATATAVERTLRNLLRFDPRVPDEERLVARSPTELPHDQLILALRKRELISLRLAGQIHELEQASRRAGSGAARPADADQAYDVVKQLRSEIAALTDQPVQSVPVALDSTIVGTEPVGAPGFEIRERKIPVAAVAALAFFVLLSLVALTMLFGDSDLEKGIAAVQAERWATAEEHLVKAAKDPDDATAQLYLARVYRRQQEYDKAAEVLKTATARHPDDADVSRELGNLFMDLGQPQLAVQRFRRAQELSPEEKLNWIGLIRALREAHDPAAEQVLQQAPSEVRAALTRTN